MHVSILQTSVSHETLTSSKTHASSLQSERLYETSSKSHTSSLQNKHFVRDFLQKSSRNPHRTTHIKQPCQAVSRFQPLQTTPAHMPIPMSQPHSPPQLATSRFPAPATKLSVSTRLTRTKYCPATKCHLRHTSQPHSSLRLPRKSHFHTSKPAQSTAPAPKSDNITSCELQQNLQLPHDSSLFQTNLARHTSMQNPLQKASLNGSTLAPYCGRRRTVADG